MPPDTTRAGTSPDVRSRQPRLLIFWGFFIAGVLVAVAFLLRSPHLLTNQAILALTTLTSIAIGLALGIQFSGLARRLPGLTVNGVRVAAGFLIALDLVVYAGPLFISGSVSHDIAPAFVRSATTAPNAGATATAIPAATTLSGVFDHRAGVDTVAGDATLGKTSDGKVILRFENLNSTNGPDLHVYLSK